MPARRYDLVVVGAGTAGLVMAAGAAGLGARVALVERHLMGGDCLNYGCVPSKALLRVARTIGEVGRAHSMGVGAPLTGIDFPLIMERMRRIRADLSGHDSAVRFRSLGVDVFFGQAKFAGPALIEVGPALLHFRRAAIATGARPTAPSIPGLEESGYLTNELVFSLTELPRRLAVIGGGAVGCELAQAFARFGSEVTIVEATARILGREDREAADLIGQSLQRDGVRIFTSCAISAVERHNAERLLHLSVNGTASVIRTDEILVAAGRAPNLEQLQPGAAGVNYDRNGITIDDRLRTSNPRVYAAGDVCTGLRFTHMADAMARIVIRNALFGGRARVSALTVPWCVYTEPEIAQVGLTEEEARLRGIGVRSFVQSFREVDRAVLDDEAEGFVKVLVANGSDRIVGATAVASHSGEMISEIGLAISAGLGMRKLAEVIHPYPTQAAAFRQVADAYNRSRLTPRVRRLLQGWLAVQRMIGR